MLVSAAGLLLLTGCTERTVGTPEPGLPTTQSSEAPRPTKPTSAEPDSIKPCDLLTESAAKEIGVTGEPKPRKITGATACSWRVRKDASADSYTLDVAYIPELGLKDLRSQTAEIQVGKHKAAQGVDEDTLGCVVSIQITETSRIDVVAAGSDPTKLCAPALAAAKLVEPELP
ncbi:DUF3558 domain-containing protein [Actinokineospora diospyrosa]|uniref:DUF3558 domain-containing protein n=1 Tax=Actinokineospora diospyrosa TaxID=103728 RepID=A0ABT1I8W5_9PSEU|nr:DUF3558 domain-containing protein [Actinokineospora diospyrosa]MCP2269079.1 Protein of unknown function (DUF3558) [Actinokineospora diospyrosa]